MRIMANFKYIDTSDIFSSTDAFKKKNQTKQVSYYLYKHLTSIKEEARREDSSHTEQNT